MLDAECIFSFHLYDKFAAIFGMYFHLVKYIVMIILNYSCRNLAENLKSFMQRTTAVIFFYKCTCILELLGVTVVKKQLNG